MKMTPKTTYYATCIGFGVQAIVINLSPLLFLTFQNQFDITLMQIGMLVTCNFVIQMLIDMSSALFVDKIGYRAAAVLSQVFAAIGLVGLGVFPGMMPSAYLGIILATVFLGIGGGLIEVVGNPIVESLPMDIHSSDLSLLHSFYSWGLVSVVLLSTAFFSVFGIENWKVLTSLWAVVPVINALVFSKTPIVSPKPEDEKLSFAGLFKTRVFWVLLVLMICAGVSEQAISQWASLFAEAGLGVSKSVGDILGPCLFAVLMGISRVYYAKADHGINLRKFIMLSACLCVVSYVIVVFSPFPVISLLGCGLCGLSVGIMWPGVVALAAKYCPKGGTAMYSSLALFGDIGCSLGPTMVGLVAGESGGATKMFEKVFANGSTDEIALKIGILSTIIFPIAMVITTAFLSKLRKRV